MKRHASFVLLAFALGCSKKPAEPAPAEPAAPAAPAAEGTEAPSEAAPAKGGTDGTAEPTPAEPAPNEPGAAEGATPKAEGAPDAPPVEGTVAKVALAPAPEAAPVPALKALTPLPPPPDEILPLVARRASMACSEAQGGAVCPAILELAAKIEADPEAAQEVAEKGTDQEKRALRDALLHVRDPKCDALVAGVLLDGSGAVDPAVARHVAFLRTPVAVKPLLDRLPKSAADETVLIIDTLASIGGEDALKALVAGLDDQKLAPYWGELCRGVTRNGVVDALKRIQEIGQSLAATERQSEGCRSSEAALRMLNSAGDLIYNVGGYQQPVGRALVRQKADDPSTLEVSLQAGADATCESPGEVRAVFSVPTDRDGAPIVGAGVAASLRSGAGKEHGTAPVYFFRFDAVDTTKGGAVSGKVYATHVRNHDEAHLIVAGPFTGLWCGE